MSAPPDDVLELLYPTREGARDLGRARDLQRLLGLLAHDAGDAASPRVALDPARAVSDLDGHARGELCAALEDLLRLHLHALLDADAFRWYGPAQRDHGEAWATLAEHRARLAWVPELPAPGEGALEVAQRLVEGLGPAGCDDGRVALWRARVTAATDVASAERALEARLQDAADGFDGPLADEARADLAAARLERGDVRGALDVLDRHPLGGARAATLARWARACSTGHGSARADDASAPVAVPAHVPVAVPAHGPVPAPLCELRAECAPLLADLAGRAATDGRAAQRALEALESPPRERRALGAVLLEWVAFDGATARTVHLDAAPALGERHAAWRRARDGAWTAPGAPEHELLRTAGVVLLRDATGAGGALRDLACDAGARAVALVPCLDDRDALAGWLHVEWEHLLVPSRARLAALAGRMVDSLAHGSVASHSATPSGGGPEWTVDAAEADCWDETCAALVRALGPKLRHRRYWFLLLGEDGATRCVASGGGGLAGSPAGGGSALRRALQARAPVVVDEPAAGRTLAADACSAVALPLCLGGRPVAAFVCESERRRDFRARDVERWRAQVATWALPLRLREWARWHEHRFGTAPVFAADRASVARTAERVGALARASSAVALHGPRAAGKRTLARWLHFETPGGRDLPLRRFEAPPATPGAREPLAPFLTDGWAEGAGSVLLAHPERATPRDQARLLEALERGRGGPRLFVTLAEAPRVHAERGELSPPLAERLERTLLAVEGLAARREELAGLVPTLLARVAREEGVTAPRLADDALACLWRQPWPGNFVELENALCKVALDREGEEVDEVALRGTLEVYGIELSRRLPSRHPRAADVAAALDVTRHETGRWNKTRAALYLGWDPDTLVARMRDLGLDADAGPSAADAMDAAAADAPDSA